MWSAIQAHSAKHALFYAIAIGLGAQAFFTGLYDNFWSLEPADASSLGWWQILALLCKSLSAPIGIVVGYMIKAPNGHIVGEVTSQTSSTTTTVKTDTATPAPTPSNEKK
jgi:hypothetical protein